MEPISIEDLEKLDEKIQALKSAVSNALKTARCQNEAVETVTYSNNGNNSGESGTAISLTNVLVMSIALLSGSSNSQFTVKINDSTFSLNMENRSGSGSQSRLDLSSNYHLLAFPVFCDELKIDYKVGRSTGAYSGMNVIVNYIPM